MGASGQASVGVGASANALVGGFNRAFSLQPLSVGAQAGLNLALGVANEVINASSCRQPAGWRCLPPEQAQIVNAPGSGCPEPTLCWRAAAQQVPLNDWTTAGSATMSTGTSQGPRLRLPLRQ